MGERERGKRWMEGGEDVGEEKGEERVRVERRGNGGGGNKE